MTKSDSPSGSISLTDHNLHSDMPYDKLLPKDYPRSTELQMELFCATAQIHNGSSERLWKST